MNTYQITFPDGTVRTRQAKSHLRAAELALKRVCKDWRMVVRRYNGEPQCDGSFYGIDLKGVPMTDAVYVEEV